MESAAGGCQWAGIGHFRWRAGGRPGGHDPSQLRGDHRGNGLGTWIFLATMPDFRGEHSDASAYSRDGRGDSAVRTLGLKQVATARFGEIVARVRELMDGREVATDDATIRIRWASGPPYASAGPTTNFFGVLCEPLWSSAARYTEALLPTSPEKAAM